MRASPTLVSRGRGSCGSCWHGEKSTGDSTMINKLFDLTGRVGLVSGAAQGMGRAMAIALAEAGADLLLADINTGGVQRTAGHIAALGRRAIPVTCDVAEP